MVQKLKQNDFSSSFSNTQTRKILIACFLETASVLSYIDTL